MRRAFAAAILLALGACGDSGFRAHDRAAAEYRDAARDVYEALLTPSCPPTSDAPRSTALAGERERVRRAEERAQSAAGFHLAVARSDLLYRQATGTLGCQADDDPAFAGIHTGMARRRVRVGLDRMAALAPGLTAPSGPEATAAIAATAPFRARVRELIAYSRPLCPLSTAADNDEIMKAVVAEVVRFRSELTGRYALHFDLAQADTVYEQSQTVVECAEPGSTPIEPQRRQAFAGAARLLAAVRAAMAAS